MFSLGGHDEYQMQQFDFLHWALNSSLLRPYYTEITAAINKQFDRNYRIKFVNSCREKSLENILNNMTNS